MNKRVVLKIYGRVQNVFFRDATRRQAKKLGLTGYVMNQEDGSVVITAEGEKDKLKELIDWCYNGPILAKVEKIDIDWQKVTGQFKKFEIRY